jgi:hypothetical protein
LENTHFTEKIFQFRKMLGNILMDFCSARGLAEFVGKFCDPELDLVDLHLLYSRDRNAFPSNGRTFLAQAARLRSAETCEILLETEKRL